MNYMAKVAEMFGVELGEKFKLKDKLLREECLNEYYIDYYSFYSVIGKTPCLDPVSLERVLCGRYELVKLPWKPKNGDVYWYLEIGGEKALCKTIWNNSTFDLAMYKLGKIYRTRSEAVKHVDEDTACWDEIRKELKQNEVIGE